MNKKDILKTLSEVAGIPTVTAPKYTIEPGERVAQLVIVPIITPEIEEADELSTTVRGVGGFGSTGTK